MGRHKKVERRREMERRRRRKRKRVKQTAKESKDRIVPQSDKEKE